MAKYYYDRYLVKRGWIQTAPEVYLNSTNRAFQESYKNYTFDEDTNLYSFGTTRWDSAEPVFTGSYFYSASNSILDRYVSKENLSYASTSGQVDIFRVQAVQNSQADLRGPLHTANVIADDGTYPNNGKHTDGYWYVRKGIALVNPTLSLKIDNAWRAYDDGWVNIDGVWRQIDTIHVNIDGTWRKSE